MTARTVTWHCPPKTVLVGVDFGDASARALAIAGVVAAGFDARLRVLHAERFETPPYFTVEQIDQLEAAHHAATASAAAHLAHFATTASGLAVDSAVADAPPVDALLGASATVDLIVLGTHGRRAHVRRTFRARCRRRRHQRRTAGTVRRRAVATGVADRDGDTGSLDVMGLPGAVSKVLGACNRPVLFMPAFEDESETDHDH